MAPFKSDPNNKLVVVDIDETIALHNLSDFDPCEYVAIPYIRGDFQVVPHTKNIKLLRKFYKLGYQVIFWSRTGADWAESVCKVLKLEDIAAAYLTKPMYYFDDKNAESWIGPRIWRDPVTGKEQA